MKNIVDSVIIYLNDHNLVIDTEIADVFSYLIIGGHVDTAPEFCLANGYKTLHHVGNDFCGDLLDVGVSG